MSKLLGIKELCEFWQNIKADLDDKANASDVYSKTETDDRYVNVTGDTMTGALTITGAGRRLYVNNTSAATEAYIDVENSKGRAVLDAYSDGKRGLWVSGSGWVIYGVAGQNYNQADNMYKITSVHRAVSYIVGAKGDAALYCPKTYNAAAWYPAVCLETKGGGSWQIGNYNDETLQFVYATKANRDSSTNTVHIASLPSITANKTICFTDHTHAAGDITSGTFADARIPNLAASKITSGTFADARIPSLAASKITSGTFGIDRIPTITVAKGGTGRTVGFQWTQIMGGTSISNGSTKSVGSITGYKEIMIICRPSTNYVASVVLPVDFFDSTAYEIYLTGGSTAANASSYAGRAACCSLTSGGTFKAIVCKVDGVSVTATWFIRGR